MFYPGLNFFAVFTKKCLCVFRKNGFKAEHPNPDLGRVILTILTSIFKPEKTEAVNIFGKRVFISKGAKAEIERVVSTELPFENIPTVPTPLPAGGEIAAVWASNLTQPRGTAQKFKSNLAESYSKITHEEFQQQTGMNHLSGDQILAVLDLPNLRTSEIAKPKFRL